MDYCRSVPVSGDCHQPEHHLAGSTLDDLFSAQNTEVDVSLEWLSVFVEECFSSTGNYLPAPSKNVVPTITNTTPKPSKPSLKPQEKPSSMQKFSVPGKARSKRKKRAAATTTSKAQNPFTTSIWSQQTTSDPPLLQQTYWLADSELIVPKKMEEMEKRSSENGGQQQGRRCSHCQSQRTPQWRAGPLGPKTLCNACGVRYKSGRLLPEYRPAKSPTFVSYLHSNSHKKVLEMRMSIVPSD